jgi:hypothetical protein
MRSVDGRAHRCSTFTFGSKDTANELLLDDNAINTILLSNVVAISWCGNTSIANIWPAVPSRRHSVSTEYAVEKTDASLPLEKTNLFTNPLASTITAPILSLSITPLLPDSPVMGMHVNLAEHIDDE